MARYAPIDRVDSARDVGCLQTFVLSLNGSLMFRRGEKKDRSEMVERWVVDWTIENLIGV